MKLVVKIFAGVVISVTALFAVALVVLTNLNFNDYKYVIEKQVQDATGRNFEIRGPLEIDLSMTPSVMMRDVVLANADWARTSALGGGENMLNLDQLDVKLDLKKIIFDGILDIHHLEVSGLNLDVQKDAKGRLNTDFNNNQQKNHEKQFSSSVDPVGTKQSVDSEFLLPILRKVKLSDVNIRYIDPSFSGVENLNITQILIDDAKNGTGMSLTMDASAGEFPLTATGSFGSIADLIDVSQPWKFDVVAQLASLDLELNGQLNDPSNAQGLQMAVKANSKEIGNLTALVAPFGGGKIPALGPLVAASEMAMDQKQNLVLKNVNVKLGNGEVVDVDIVGEVANLNSVSGINLDVKGESPSVERLLTLLNISLPYTDLGAFKTSAKINGSLDNKITISSLSFALDNGNKHALNLAGKIDDVQNFQGAGLKVDGNIASLSEITKALGLELPIGDLGIVDFSTEVSGDLMGSISLAAMDVSLRKNKKHSIKIEGSIGDAKEVSDLDLKISGNINSTEDISNLLGMDLPIENIGVSKFFANVIGSQKTGLSLPEINLSLIKKNEHALYVKGAISDVENLSDVDVLYDLDVASLTKLGSTLHQNLPSLGSVSSQGNIVGSLDSELSLKEFKGKVQQSEFEGSAKLSLAKPIPHLEATLNVNKIVTSDFKLANESQQAQQKSKASNSSSVKTTSNNNGKVIPDEKIDFSGLKELSANLNLDVGLIQSSDLALKPVKLGAKLSDGILEINHMSLGDGSGGALTGAFKLNAQQPEALTSVSLTSEKFDVAPLISVAGYRGLIAGNMQLNVDLSANGQTPHALASSLGGHVQAVLVDGKMDAKSVEQYFGKGAKAVTDLLTGGRAKEFDVYCVLADYQVSNGLVQTQNMMIDTEVSTILSDGVVDLGKEKLDLTVTPRGEVLGFGAAIPVLVQGSFNNVQAVPDPKAIVTVLGSALAAGSAWPAALAGALVLSDEGRTACSGSSRKEPIVEQVLTKPVDVGKEVVKGLLNNLFGN